MTDYVKSTNFASKDNLASGNPLKIIKGTEFDTEFNNIATAIATKADTASPALTGTPTAPTAAAGTNTVQLATTAFVQTAVSNSVTAERTATVTLTNKTLESPTLAGNPVAPTPVTADNDTSVATTAYVVARVAQDAPTKSGTGATGTWNINISGNAATASNGLGAGQNWSSPSRSAGVWYQNTTGKPIMVNIVFGSYGAGYLYVGTSTTSYATANFTDNDINQINGMSGVVPDGYYYQCTGGFYSWYELR